MCHGTLFGFTEMSMRANHNRDNVVPYQATIYWYPIGRIGSPISMRRSSVAVDVRTRISPGTYNEAVRYDP